MEPVFAAAGCFVLYIVVYRFYARYLAKSIFQLDPAKLTPAHEINDGVDYVPCRRPVLFGHVVQVQGILVQRLGRWSAR